MLEIFVGDCEEQSMGVMSEKFNKIFIDVVILVILVKNWGIRPTILNKFPTKTKFSLKTYYS